MATATAVGGLCGYDIPPLPDAAQVTRVVYVDSEATTPSLFTTTKTTHRQVYNAARARVNLSSMPTPADAHIDVLLYNTDGNAMETSIRNIAFMRGNCWVTPSLASGCLPGVMRRLMLEEYDLVERDVKLSDIALGEIVLTANGVEGIHYAKIVQFSATL